MIRLMAGVVLAAACAAAVVAEAAPVLVSLDKSAWTTESGWSSGTYYLSNTDGQLVMTSYAQPDLNQGAYVRSRGTYNFLDKVFRMKWQVDCIRPGWTTDPFPQGKVWCGPASQRLYYSDDAVFGWALGGQLSASIAQEKWVYSQLRIDGDQYDITLGHDGYGSNDIYQNSGTLLPQRAQLLSNTWIRFGMWKKQTSSTFTIAEASLTPVDEVPPPRMFVLAIGMNYYPGGYSSTGTDMDGATAATMIHQRLSQFGSFHAAGSQVLILDPTLEDASNQDRILKAIDDIAGQLAPNDRFVMYYSGHGGCEEDPWDEDVPSEADEIPRPVCYPFTNISWFDNVGDENLIVAKGPEDFQLNDDMLAEALTGGVWDDVDKTVLLDACLSGGFWDGDPTVGHDLEDVPRCALLAAAPEDEFCVTNPLSKVGFWTEALDEALGEVQVSGGTFADVGEKLATKRYPELAGQSFNIHFRSDDGSQVLFKWNPVFLSSPDYDPRIAIPEPGSPVLLATLVLALLACRRKGVGGV